MALGSAAAARRSHERCRPRSSRSWRPWMSRGGGWPVFALRAGHPYDRSTGTAAGTAHARPRSDGCRGARGRLFTLLHDARPALINLGAPGELDLGRWAERVVVFDARYAGIGAPCPGPGDHAVAVLVRPDGYVAWVGDGTDRGLAEALATWFGSDSQPPGFTIASAVAIVNQMVEHGSRELDAVFHAPAHDARRTMLRRLAGRELTVGELAAPLDMSLPAASKHLQVLRRAGLVQRTGRGRRNVRRLAPGPLAGADEWLRFDQRYWSEQLDALGRIFEDDADRRRPMTHPSATAVHLRRTIAAPPERVYRAWLDPQLISRWFAPADFTVQAVEVDERVGGRLRIWHADDDGNDAGGAEAEILELVPGERIVLDWQFVARDRATDPALATRLTIALTPLPRRHPARPHPRSARRPARPPSAGGRTGGVRLGVRARRPRRDRLVGRRRCCASITSRSSRAWASRAGARCWSRARRSTGSTGSTASARRW